MKIKKDSKLVWLMKLNYHITNEKAYDHKDRWDGTVKGKIPHSLCSFFWASIGVIIITAFNIPGLIISLVNKRRRQDPANTSDILANPLFWGLIQVVAVTIGANTLIDSGLSVYIHESYIIKALASLGAGLLMMVAVCALILIVVAPIIWIGKIYDDYKMDRRKRKRAEDKEGVEKQPSLLMAFFKAKKEKVCPIIEFED